MLAHSSRNETQRKIVLLGKTGVGKSSTGNTLLGEKQFKTGKRLNSITKECSVEKSFVEGRNVSVVDTPGFFDSTLSEKYLEKEIARSVLLPAPGVHAFLFVLTVDRFTKQEKEVLENIEELFGEGVLNYLILLFTNGNDVELDTFRSEVYQHNILGPIVERCQGRFHVFNNKAMNDRDQVRDLLLKIDSMVEQNGGPYSSEMMEVAQRFREEEEKRERGKQKRQKEEEEKRERVEQKRQREEEEEEEEKRKRVEQKRQREEEEKRERVEQKRQKEEEEERERVKQKRQKEEEKRKRVEQKRQREEEEEREREKQKRQREEEKRKRVEHKRQREEEKRERGERRRRQREGDDGEQSSSQGFSDTQGLLMDTEEENRYYSQRRRGAAFQRFRERFRNFFRRLANRH